ncbi:hypothetical protein M427DRAFT_55734 [Gonapodya prolifera JEL478]|uniref:Rhodanese domain-containing protein n=1 Tax=Gonapodya prolifera (strain JEL478) TaxID=1344416 RepID=A0A139AIR6_GONPJ|nr:hypothetical protein M427DRAFT_55734 [Gonapodya prolifera JEL478]|eukprot:KXS16305.1 hypothetical protein M427DRAFT_55734 [Gonapodya prolifera JEL478]
MAKTPKKEKAGAKSSTPMEAPSFFRKYWWAMLISVASALAGPNLTFAGPGAAVAMAPFALVLPFLPYGVPGYFEKITPHDFAELLAMSPLTGPDPPRPVPDAVIDPTLKLVVVDVREPIEVENKGILDAPNVINVPGSVFRSKAVPEIRRFVEEIETHGKSAADVVKLRLRTDAEVLSQVTVAAMDSHGNRAIKGAFALAWERKFKRVVAVAGGQQVWGKGFRRRIVPPQGSSAGDSAGEQTHDDDY